MDVEEDEGDASKKSKKCITFKDLTSVKAKVYYINAMTTWGDRMWNFAVSLFLVKMAKDSQLRLSATYGLVSSLAVILLGAVIGRYIDRIPRFKAAVTSLIVQNTSIVCCTVTVYATFMYADDLKNEYWRIHLLHAGVITTGAIALLASLASTICMAKDWVVVIAKGDNELLTNMNATCRRIDLVSNICSPFLVGNLMHQMSNWVTAVFIMTWNLLSMLVEYCLLRSIYKSVPELAMDKNVLKDSTQVIQEPIEADSLINNDDTTSDKTNRVAPRKSLEMLKEYGNAWKAYFRHPILPAGLGLAFLYMTVLAFDGITIGYAYGQGISEAVLAGMGAAGALIGVIATLVYPKLRLKIGVERTGLIGFCAEVSCLVLCVISVWAPGSPFNPNVLKTSSISIPSENATIGNATSEVGKGKPEVKRDYTSVILLMAGIAFARFGLWMADLSVNQIFQEEVEESWRGRINGVQHALNMTMDLLKYGLVILLPSAETFGLLVLASFIFICSGLSYSSYCMYQT